MVFGVLQFSNSFPETKNHVYDLASADAMSVELNCLNGTISLPYLLQTKYYSTNPRVKSLVLRQLSVTDQCDSDSRLGYKEVLAGK